MQFDLEYFHFFGEVDLFQEALLENLFDLIRYFLNES